MRDTIAVSREVLAELVALAEFQRLRLVLSQTRSRERLRKAEMCHGEASIQKAREEFADAEADALGADKALLSARVSLAARPIEEVLEFYALGMVPVIPASEPLVEGTRTVAD